MVGDVLDLLNEVDPYGLEPGAEDGAPRDEYAPEAAAIAELLFKGGAVDEGAVDAVWLKWFDEPLSGVIGTGCASEFVARTNALATDR
ncbi:hypothetical protein F6B41_06030 [Microbacterium lushaniae]|nr:hypothetical protein F6B41_28165 [Microbacterium lushaniae]KAA9157413.1 hypothetical protein F6B41_06030 [Microbacterium lushaniae]